MLFLVVGSKVFGGKIVQRDRQYSSTSPEEVIYCESLDIVKNQDEMVTSIKHPCADYEVSVQLDPIHNYKLIRGTMADYKELVWPGEGRVSWKFIELLHAKQKEHGLGVVKPLCVIISLVCSFHNTVKLV